MKSIIFNKDIYKKFISREKLAINIFNKDLYKKSTLYKKSIIDIFLLYNNNKERKIS